VQRCAHYKRQASAIGVHHSPVLAVAGALRLSVHSRLNSTASKPVAFSATSRFASKERGTSGERGGGATPTGSAGTVGECFAVPLPCASPDSSTRTASASGYLSGEGAGSFFNTNGGGCAGVAFGIGELFVACCACTAGIPTAESARHCHYTFRLHDVPHRTFDHLISMT